MKFLKIIMLISIVKNVSAQQFCCPEGNYTISEDETCWDPKSNTTSPFLLACELVAVEEFTIGEDKQITVPVMEGVIIHLDPERYCVGNDTSFDDVTDVLYKALLCVDAPPILDLSILGYCRVASVVFLVITLVIYGVLSELRDVQGKCIINFCASLSLGLGILAIMEIFEYTDMTLCAVRGFLAYFFMMAVFFWSNAISIQILLGLRRSHIRDYSWNEFKWYMVYAWGCPTVLTLCMIIVNYLPGHHKKPGIGLTHCWFHEKMQAWYYFYSVLTLLMAVNIGIFTYISMGLCRLQRTSNHLKAFKYKFILSVRLILLMGLPWVFEMLESLSGQHIFWTITNVFNALQGVLIFLVLVVFRRRVIKIMYQRHWLDCISGLVERYLAVDGDEESVVQHTELPIN